MVELGTAHGVATRALLTDMDGPLGRAVGNAVEVAESLDVLAGGGPDDVVALTLALAGEMLDAAGVDGVDPAETLADGTAMDRFRDAGGRAGRRPVRTVADRCTFRDHHRTARWHDGRHRRDGGGTGGVAARRGPLDPGRAGAVRRRDADPPRPGEPVAAGEPLFTLYTDTPERFGGAIAELDGGWSVGDTAPQRPSPDHRSDHR